MKSKIKSLSQIVKIVEDLKNNNYKVGLITGCFDILHVGHIDLFKFAKKHVDYLVVGVDTDKSISLTKGKNRPIIPQKYRIELLSELAIVDYVFLQNSEFSFNSKPHNDYMRMTYKLINPSAVITEGSKDKYLKKKYTYTKQFKIKLIVQKRLKITPSTSEIIFKASKAD